MLARTLRYVLLTLVGLVLSGLVLGLLVPIAGAGIGRGVAAGITALIVLGVVVAGSRWQDRRTR